MDLKLDARGHLASANDWNDTIARHLAETAGIELGAEHWRVLRILRRFHGETGIAPSMRPLVKLLRQNEPPLASSIALLRLFPSAAGSPDSPAVVAARIAGLPRPDKCL